MRPLFELRQRGEEPGTGRVLADLVPTGQKPTFIADLEVRGYRAPDRATRG